jgi:hypothetical protein
MSAMWFVMRSPAADFPPRRAAWSRPSLRRDVAHRDVAAFGDHLARQFAADTHAVAGNDGNLSGKILHWYRRRFLCRFFQDLSSQMLAGSTALAFQAQPRIGFVLKK